jgi:hypothetical protein
VTPTGYFDYDPVAQVFVDFVVVAGGATFDVTAAASNPGIIPTDPCNPGYQGAAATFGMLAGCANGAVTWNLIPMKSPSQSVFNIEASGNGEMAIDAYTVQSTFTSGAVSSGSFTITAASGTPCVFSLNSAGAAYTSSGGTGLVSVLTSPPTNCPWTGISNASWLTIVSGAPGTGPATVNYSVAPNTGANAQNRNGALTIAGQTFTVNQAGFHPQFFAGETLLSGGVYFLQFADGNLFGFYNYQYFPWIYHYDLGFEYFFDANDGAGGAYLYDLTSTHWWFTSSSLFPYLYDFTLNTWIYYVPDSSDPGHYTSNPRNFAYTSNHQVFTM